MEVQALKKAIAKLKRQADMLDMAEQEGGEKPEEEALEGEESPEGEEAATALEDVGETSEEDVLAEEGAKDTEGSMTPEEIKEYLKPKKKEPKKSGVMVAALLASSAKGQPKKSPDAAASKFDKFKAKKTK